MKAVQAMIAAIAMASVANAFAGAGDDENQPRSADELQMARDALGEQASKYESVAVAEFSAEEFASIEPLFNPLQAFFQVHEDVQFNSLLEKIDFISSQSESILEESYFSLQAELPHVCDPGIACRKKIMDQVRLDVTELWREAIIKIDRLRENTSVRVGWKLDHALIDAEACKGCRGLFSCPVDANERHHVMH